MFRFILYLVMFFSITFQVYAVSTGETGFEVFEASNLGIGTNNVDGGAVIVKGAGNVGIGSSWPGRTLDVFGDIRATNVGISTLGMLYGNGSLLTSMPSIGMSSTIPTGVYLTVPTNNLGIGTSTALADLFIDVNNARVGVGTFAPIGILEVRNATESQFLIDTAGNVGIGTNMVGAEGKLIVMEGNVGVGTILGSTSALSVMSGGMGIGTWAPSSNFQVRNNLNTPFSVSSTGNVGIGTVNAQSPLIVIAGNVGINTLTAEGGALIVKTGNMGVGTSFPGAELDVAGDVRFRGQILATRTTDIGIAVVSTTNQACNTTCTGACLLGQNHGDANEVLVSCTSALADRCICFQ